jgi:hypothetical protein
MKRELLVVKRFATHIKEIVLFYSNMGLGFLVAIMIILLPNPGFSEVAGYFSHIRNEVELRKQGKPPSIQAKVQDKVEVLDAIRTGISGKATIKFVDDSLLIISPGSNLIIDKFMFDLNKSFRQVKLSFFRGLFYNVVKYSIKAKEPEFIINTYTAVLGERGTAWYTIADTTFTDVFCEHGKLSMQSNQLKEQVAVNGFQASRVWKGQKPLQPLSITSKDLSFLKSLLDSGLPLRYEPGKNPLELLRNLKKQISNKVRVWTPPPAIGIRPGYSPTPGPGSLPPVSPPTPPAPTPTHGPSPHRH